MDNPLRKAVVWLVTWSAFKNFILLVIIFNSVTIGMENKEHRVVGNHQETSLDKFVIVSGQICTIIFLVEFALKVLAQGFIIHSKSYMRDNWNKLDFVIVIVSIFELF